MEQVVLIDISPPAAPSSQDADVDLDMDVEEIMDITPGYFGDDSEEDVQCKHLQQL